MVRWPRQVLTEFGLIIPPDVEVRVHDSNQKTRYMLLPLRLGGTEGWGEEQLASIVTRDTMIGVAVPRADWTASTSPARGTASRNGWHLSAAGSDHGGATLGAAGGIHALYAALILAGAVSSMTWARISSEIELTDFSLYDIVRLIQRAKILSTDLILWELAKPVKFR